MKIAESSSKVVEDTVRKGEIARYEQFLVLTQCFQKTCTADTRKPGPVFTNHSLERSLSYSPDFSMFRSI